MDAPTTGVGTLHTDTYFERMRSSAGDKARLLEHLVPGNVLDVGAGDGTLVALARAAGHEAVGIDASPEAVARSHGTVVLGSAPGLAAVLGPRQRFDNVIACSVLHEIHSYAGQRSLITAVAEMADLLKPGGRLVIRDGVGPVDNPRPTSLAAKDPAYEHDFLDRWHELSAVLGPDRASGQLHKNAAGIHGPAWATTAYLLVRVWGRASLPREAQEAYTCAGNLHTRLRQLARWTGLRPVHNESYTQPGHVPHFERIGAYSHQRGTAWRPRPWPATNAIWVLAKS